MSHSFSTIGTSAQAEYSDKGSKFIAYAFQANSLDGFESRLAELRKDHPQARHWCYGWRLHEQGEKANDDGEPAHSAGTPILNQLRSAQVWNAACVVVRYFGGTKLGKPGLIQAYKAAAAEALSLCALQQVQPQKELLVAYPYTAQAAVDQLVHRHGVQVGATEYLAGVTSTWLVAEEQLTALLAAISELPAIDIKKGSR